MQIMGYVCSYEAIIKYSRLSHSNLFLKCMFNTHFLIRLSSNVRLISVRTHITYEQSNTSCNRKTQYMYMYREMALTFGEDLSGVQSFGGLSKWDGPHIYTIQAQLQCKNKKKKICESFSLSYLSFFLTGLLLLSFEFLESASQLIGEKKMFTACVCA